MLDKRSQAALEFLVNYGWAFIVVLVMVSAMASYGVFNPKRYFPEECKFGNEAECYDYSISVEDDTIGIILENALNVKLEVTDVSITTKGVTPVECTLSNQDEVYNVVWNSSLNKEFRFEGCNFREAGISADSKERFYFNITYHADQSSEKYKHNIHGELNINT